jgi:hypothetical protein
MLKFKALAASALEMADLNSFVVVLAEESDGGGMRLEIQRALEFDEQDKQLWQDTYCVCTESGATCYGGIASWALLGNELEIILDVRAQSVLGVKDGFLVELAVDADALARISRGLVIATS